MPVNQRPPNTIPLAPLDSADDGLMGPPSYLANSSNPASTANAASSSSVATPTTTSADSAGSLLEGNMFAPYVANVSDPAGVGGAISGAANAPGFFDGAGMGMVMDPALMGAEMLPVLATKNPIEATQKNQTENNKKADEALTYDIKKGQEKAVQRSRQNYEGYKTLMQDRTDARMGALKNNAIARTSGNLMTSPVKGNGLVQGQPLIPNGMVRGGVLAGVSGPGQNQAGIFPQTLGTAPGVSQASGFGGFQAQGAPLQPLVQGSSGGNGNAPLQPGAMVNSGTVQSGFTSGVVEAGQGAFTQGSAGSASLGQNAAGPGSAGTSTPGQSAASVGSAGTSAPGQSAASVGSAGTSTPGQSAASVGSAGTSIPNQSAASVGSAAASTPNQSAANLGTVGFGLGAAGSASLGPSASVSAGTPMQSLNPAGGNLGQAQTVVAMAPNGGVIAEANKLMGAKQLDPQGGSAQSASAPSLTGSARASQTKSSGGQSAKGAGQSAGATPNRVGSKAPTDESIESIQYLGDYKATSRPGLLDMPPFGSEWEPSSLKSSPREQRKGRKQRDQSLQGVFHQAGSSEESTEPLSPEQILEQIQRAQEVIGEQDKGFVDKVKRFGDEKSADKILSELLKGEEQAKAAQNRSRSGEKGNTTGNQKIAVGKSQAGQSEVAQALERLVEHLDKSEQMNQKKDEALLAGIAGIMAEVPNEIAYALGRRKRTNVVTDVNWRRSSYVYEKNAEPKRRQAINTQNRYGVLTGGVEALRQGKTLNLQEAQANALQATPTTIKNDRTQASELDEWVLGNANDNLA